QMAIPGRELGLVAQNHDVAVTALAPRNVDDAVRGCFHARAGGRAIVDAFVRAPHLQYRVKARGAEAGRYARKFERRAQELLAQVLAVRRVIAAFVFGVIEVHRSVSFALVHELGGEHASGLDWLTAIVEHFIDDAEAVAFAQV